MRRRRSAIVAALALTAAAYAGWRAWSRRAARAGLPSGRVHRTAKLARASTKTAAHLAVTKARSLGKDDDERAVLEEQFHLRTAEQVMEIMGEMKGALMKIGQMVSFIDTGLPEPYRQALAALQADAPPMAPELVAEVVEAELGAPPDRVFEAWDDRPLAAASIGQVHAARLAPSGDRPATDVVVKVQYPGVAEAIRSDLDNAEMLYTMMRAIYPNLDPKPVVAEMRERIGEELDYENELKNQLAFLDIYRGHPFIHVPEVFPEVSTRRILTMERSHGHRWGAALAAGDELKQRWAEVAFRFVFGTINRWHMFNGDPHPGNYLFHDDGRVTFLDYGCVKHFPPDHIERQRALLRAEWAGDGDTMRRHLVDFGFIKPDDATPPERLVEWWQTWDQPILQDAFTYTAEFAEAAAKANFDPTSEWYEISRRFNLPKDFVFLTRINLGLNSIFAGLGAHNCWRAIGQEWWEGGPPATELGRLDHDFFASAVPPRS
ncbi:MAG: AarF/ABC1/UbiB kinase family protein [Actinobacteria bacterium]|nr:AarF/ABC1/UbiB kinase family protein [Actinomycetota bacterium]